MGMIRIFLAKILEKCAFTGTNVAFDGNETNRHNIRMDRNDGE